MMNSFDDLRMVETNLIGYELIIEDKLRVSCDQRSVKW